MYMNSWYVDNATSPKVRKPMLRESCGIERQMNLWQALNLTITILDINYRPVLI
jgi:hypothetical protein